MGQRGRGLGHVTDVEILGPPREFTFAKNERRSFCYTSEQHECSSKLATSPSTTETQTSIDISVIRDTERPSSFVQDLRRDEIRGC